MNLEVLRIVIVDSIRKFEGKVSYKIEKIFPEINKLFKPIFYSYILFQIIFLIFISFINFSDDIKIIRIVKENINLFLLIKYFLESTIILQVIKFNLPKKIEKLYGYPVAVFYIICSSFGHFYSFLLIQIIFFRITNLISTIGISMLVFLICLSLTLIKGKIIKKILSYFRMFLLFIIFIMIINSFLLNELISLKINSTHYFLLITESFLLVTLYLLRKKVMFYTKSTTKKINKKNFNGYLLLLVFFIIQLVCLKILSYNFQQIKILEFPLLILLFLVNMLFLKIKYIKLLTIESYGYFLFYIKSMSIDCQKQILQKIKINNIAFTIPFLVASIIYLLNDLNYNFIIFIIIMYLIDVNLDELIMYITRKIERKDNLSNLFVNSKKGLSNVLLIALIPSPIIATSIKQGSISNIFTPVLLLIFIVCVICLILVGKIWEKTFFKDLYK